MRLLLDTRVFLWFVTADPRLPAKFRAAIQDPANEIHLSSASVWEAVIKYQIGKLPLPGAPADFLPRARAAHGIASLPIDERTMVRLASLPAIHRDPFDRLLVAHAQQHGLTMLTIDPQVAAYSVPTLPTT